MPRDTMGRPQVTKEEKEQQRRWQAEDDFRTLGRAAEIHADEERKKAVMEMHQEHADMLQKMFSSNGDTKAGEESKKEEKPARKHN